MSQPKRILMICKSLPWRFNGGIQTHTWELTQAMVRQGQEVCILTGGAFSRPKKSYHKNGVKIIEIPFFPGRYLKPISFLAEEFSFNWTVKGWVKKHEADYDVIHIQGRSGYLLVLNSQIRKKLVTTFHGLISKEGSKNRWYDFNLKLHMIWVDAFEKILALKSQLSIAVSNSLIEDIRLKNPQANNIKLIPNGVKTGKVISSRNTSDEVRFLFVGRLHPIKGLEKLINHFQHAQPEVQLDIVGDGPIYKTLKEQVVSLGLQERIHFLGAHDNHVVHTMLYNYRALVLPSSYETQGIVLLEANAQSVPVIASDLPAIRESVIHGHNGLLCDPRNGKAFIDAMNFLTKDEEYASKMGASGYLHVQRHFGWESIAAETIATYQKLAS